MGQWRPSGGFRSRHEERWGCWLVSRWQLFGWGESQSSDVSSAMSSDCVSDISKSLRMLSGWARVTSRRPSLSDTPGDSPSSEPHNAPPLRELQSWGSSPPETGTTAVKPGCKLRSSSLVRQRWLGLVSMSTWISRLVPSLIKHSKCHLKYDGWRDSPASATHHSQTCVKGKHYNSSSYKIIITMIPFSPLSCKTYRILCICSYLFLIINNPLLFLS